MQIVLASPQTVGSEPPPRPPPPPPPVPPVINSDTTRAIPPPPPPQDTATRKQQQPLSAISIQDLNSVQVLAIIPHYIKMNSILQIILLCTTIIYLNQII